MLNGGLLLAASVLHARVPAEVLANTKNDAAASALAQQVSRWLPAAGGAPPGLLERALFRMRMRGGAPHGASYLLRLLLSPTEEDWDADAHKASKSRRFVDVLKRPFRLAKKHRTKE